MRITVIPTLIFFLFLAVFPVTSQSLESLDNATQAYNNGDIDNAIQFFELTVSGGIINGEIFYNLGNAYYEQGDIGKSLLNYRRAMQFIPRDLDLNIQIARVRSLRTTLQTDTTHWLIILEQVTESVVTITELSIVTFLIWSLFWIILAFYRLNQAWRSALKFPLSALFSVLLSLSILLCARLYIYHNMPPAMVTVDSAPVYSGSSIAYFHQHDLFTGSEIYIIDEQDEWRKFVTSTNQQGWIQAKAITVIPIN
jgi:tetratricopeptide (TPR) repeat protein